MSLSHRSPGTPVNQAPSDAAKPASRTARTSRAAGRTSGLAQHLRDEEGELEGLDAVEAGVADGLVAVGEADLVDLLTTTDLWLRSRDRRGHLLASYRLAQDLSEATNLDAGG
jgi:hypothetical protein